MNQKRRAIIRKIIDALEQQKNDIEEMRDEESEARDNLPENLQGTEKYEAIELAVDQLSEAIDNLDDVINTLTEALGE